MLKVVKCYVITNRFCPAAELASIKYRNQGWLLVKIYGFTVPGEKNHLSLYRRSIEITEAMMAGTTFRFYTRSV